MAIEADRLSVSRLGKPVLREVSVRIDDGECVSIIGPNGAGKSTLMEALLGLLPADGGKMRLNGTTISSLSRRDIARKVAYVPQIHDGYTGFRVHDIVESGRYAYVAPLERLSESDREAIAEAVAACRIEHVLDRTVDTLSGGERQKVWIAAALAQQTDTLLLDEPTTALDPAHQAELIRIMRDFHRAGSTLVAVSHDLNLPLALGGRVIAIREGAVFFDEPVDVLRDTARLASLFGTQFVLHHDPGGGAVSVHLRV